MNIGRIYSRAFEITKQNRILWFFGAIMFVLLGGGGFSYNGGSGGSSSSSSSSSTSTSTTSNFDGSTTTNWASSVKESKATNDFFGSIGHALSSVPLEVWVFLGLGILLAIVLGLIISYIGRAWIQGAFVGGINEAIDNKKPTVSEISKLGFRSFKSIIWLMTVTGSIPLVALLIYLLVIVLPFVMIGVNSPDSTKFALFFIGMLIGLPVLMIPSIIVSTIDIWSIRIAQIENVSGIEAFKTAWKMVKKHFGDMFVLGIVNWFTMMGIGCLSLIVIAIVVGLFLAISVGAYLINPVLGSVGIAIFVLLILALSLAQIIIGGMILTFRYSTWTVWYREIKEGELTQ